MTEFARLGPLLAMLGAGLYSKAEAQRCAGLVGASGHRANVILTTSELSQSAIGSLGFGSGPILASIGGGVEHPRNGPTADYRAAVQGWWQRSAGTAHVCPTASVTLHLLDSGRQLDGRVGLDAALDLRGSTGSRLTALASGGLAYSRVTFTGTAGDSDGFGYLGGGIGFRASASMTVAARFETSIGGRLLAPGPTIGLTASVALGRTRTP